MQYYNTLVKIYHPEINKSIRFIRFDALRKKAITLEEKELLYMFRVNKACREAEAGEAIQSNEERDYKAESLSRAKRTVKEIIRQNFSVRLKLLTLTYATVVNKREKVLQDIKNMCKRYKECYDHELRYIATLEWQKKRDCLHVHMIVECDFIAVKIWEKVLWLQGFVKINTISYGKSKSNCLNAIDYVLKYIEKDASTCAYYSHLYMRSHNWSDGVEKEYRVTVDYDECVMLARRYFQVNDYQVTKFNYQLWDESWIEVIDIYAVE